MPLYSPAGNVTGQASSVDSEITLFSGTTGKVIKRAANTGLLKASSGVIATATAGTDYLTANQSISLTGDVTGSGTTSIACTIPANSIALADMATMATDSILGRATAATGNVEVLAALPWAYTGDVTRAADSNATVLAAGNAGNLNSGTLLAARMPAFTGDVTSTAGATANTLVNIPATTTIAGVAGTRGDVLYYGASGWAKLGAGTSGNQLTTNGAGADPTWAAPGSGGSGSPGGSTTQVQFNDAGAFQGDAGMVYSKTIPKLTLSGGATADSRLVVGTLEFQPYALNNCWFGDNIYFDATGFKYRATGAGGLFYFNGAEGQFRFFASGSAGANADPSANRAQIKVNADGTVALGGTISETVGTYTNSRMLISGAGGGGISIGASSEFGWTGTANDAALAVDTGLYRNAAGVVEINNGTAGTYRDLKLRNLTLSGTSTQIPAASPTGLFLKDDGTYAAAGGGSGDVVGPAGGVVDSQVALFNSTTGKLIKGATGNGIAKHTAGVLSTVTAPTGALIGDTDTQTLTNKRLNPRVVAVASSATWSPNCDTTDTFTITTAQAAAVTTINNPSGTPVDGQDMMFRVKCDGTARALSWTGTQYRASSDMALPTTLIASKTTYLGFAYNATDTKWDLLAKMENY